MTATYIKIGGIHPTSNRPQPTTPRISLLLHVESKSYKKLTALIMHSCPCYESTPNLVMTLAMMVGPTKVFMALRTFDDQLTIEKMGLSHHDWSQRGSTFKKKVT